MSSPLDRISEEAQIIIEYGIAVTPEDVLALVNVAEAAEARSEEHSVDCAYIQTWDGPTPMKCDCGADALRDALAALNKETTK